MNKKDKIGIITRPLVNAGITPVSNLTEILCDIYGQVCLITSCKGVDLTIQRKNLKIIDLEYDINIHPLLKVFKYLVMQFQIAWIMLKFRDVDTWIFFFEAHTLILPLLLSKMISNNTLVLVGSCLKHTWTAGKDVIIFFSLIFESIGYKITDKIILYSPNLIKEWDLEKYNKKVIINHRHFLDFEKLKVTKNIDQRENLVGFIGRLAPEKGIKKFLDAINILSKTDNNLKFLIGGDGYLKDEMEKFLRMNELTDNVNYVGWISREELPNYLNELKLLVIPSCSEGLPNTMLEAMACGTPILANPVGAIPDIIQEGVNGFLIEKNSPEYIAKDITKIINLNIQEISDNANKMVKENFNYQKVTENWDEMIKSL